MRRLEIGITRTGIYALLGQHRRAAKVSAFSPVDRFFEQADAAWTAEITSGLSSGEGIIYAVRDAVYKREKKGKKGGVDQFEETLVDAGVEDKRLLVRQSEFYSALSSMKRPGNTLSATLRDSFDRGNLKVITKNSPTKATNAHISVIGNITKEELLRGMQSDEIDNGFANRFLWACSRRSKELPEGGRLLEVVDSLEFQELVKDFNRCNGFIKGPVPRDAEASDDWGRNQRPDIGLYHELMKDRPGLFGLATHRGHVFRDPALAHLRLAR